MAEGGQDHNSGIADVMPTSLLSATSGSATLAEGENVNLNLTKSTVNVVAGNQTNVYNIARAKGEASPMSQGKGLEKLIEICNENTTKVTAIGVLDDFRHEGLQLPDFEVYPLMQQVDAGDYYKGRYGSTRFQESRNDGDHNQLTMEVGFHPQYKIGKGEIGIRDLASSLWKRKELGSSESLGITAIVASAGSGKSTLTRRLARQALGISSERDEVDDSSSYSKRMVHYIELKNVVAVGEMKPSKFLFGGLYQHEEDEDRAFEWLDKHQSEAILIFDGLDQALWNFHQKDLRQIRNHEKANSWTVMYNILSRNILRHVKIYIASREFKVSELPAMARPETIITLNGLNVRDAHRLFVVLLKEEGEKLWQKIENMSPRLLNLVAVPVFLILTAVVMGRDPTKPPPTTVTELYNRIISALQSVENIRNRAQILKIVNRLKALAFKGMKEGRVVFKETDLAEFKLTTEEVQDLMTKVPGNNLLCRHLMQGNFTFFFCHQSIQEYLAAIFIAEMKNSEFALFDKEHLHKERWSVVRRFVAGVVFSKSGNDLYKVSDGTEKQQIFCQSLRLRLEKNKEKSHLLMELYTAIYESDDENLMKDLDVIDASGISLSRDEAHIVGSLAARSRSLHSLNLKYCSIDDELLDIIARCLGNRIQVKEVTLYNNKFSATALRSLLGHRRIELLSGNLDWEVVKLTLNLPLPPIVELKNGEDVIEITGSVSGHFTIKESTLSFDRVNNVADVVFLGILFNAEFIKLNEQRLLLAKQDDLRQLSDCKLEKISKILLDCTEEEEIDWSLIETSRKKYQMEVLEIAVNGQISVEDYNRHLNRAREISVVCSIHAMFYFEKEDEFRNIVEACKQKKIECIRCIFAVGCRASVDDVSSLVNNSTLKKVSLIYDREGDMLKGDELKKAQKIANDIDIELEVLKLIRKQDAWQRLDYAFYRREYEKRESIQQEKRRQMQQR